MTLLSFLLFSTSEPW